jgi:predicted ABC-type ATPase
LDTIYGSDFNYSLPKPVLEGWLQGRGFPGSTEYTPEEKIRLKDDIATLYSKINNSNLVRTGNIAVISAGAPGAGKSVLLESLLRSEFEDGRRFAYVDPDAVCLKSGMPKTFTRDLSACDGSPAERKKLYDKWRAASNASAHLILANWVREHIPFFFGSTSTGPATGHFFQFLTEQGYQIHLVHVTAPDMVRWESINKRDAICIHVTPEDTAEKGLLLPQRIMDTYLKYAGTISFYYRSSANAPAQLAATWQQHPGQGGNLLIENMGLYEQVKAVHNTAVGTLAKLNPDNETLLWENTVEKVSSISLKK